MKKYIVKPLILFLLLSQFAAMAHAIEHQLQRVDHEHCLICRHDADSKNLLIDTTDSIKLVFSKYEKTEDSSDSYKPKNLTPYKSRSPPSFLV